MKLLIVDDHPVVRAGLRRLLAVEPGVEIVESADGEGAVRAFREHEPDLVILDLNLPGLSGLEVMRQIRSDHPNARVLGMSMYTSPFYAARVLKAGARGYISKNTPPEQILEAVGRVAAGEVYIEHDIAQEIALLNVHHPEHPLERLSLREVEMMRLLADGNSLTEIARSLAISYKTAANLCSQLKSKLAISRTADLVRLAITCRLGRADGRLSASLSPSSARSP
jgi:two-component system, NarL family, invasion response regulator UvrY